MGGIPCLDWTDLKISTADPSSPPMLNNSGFHKQSKGLDVKFSKEKGDLFSFQCKTTLVFNVKLLWHFQDTGMDTITSLKGPGHPNKMVNLLMDHNWFTQAYVKTAIEEQHKHYNSYSIIVPAMNSRTALTRPLRRTCRILFPPTSAF